MYRNTTAILPTGEKMNPLHPEKAFYFHKDQTALVLERKGTKNRSLRVFTTAGGPGPYKVGASLQAHHDQTGRFLGDFTIIGIHHFDSGAIYGEVPDRTIAQGVFK